MLTSFHYLGLLQADPRNAENGVGVGWSLHKMLFLPLKGLLIKVLHKRFIFAIENSVSITLKIVWLLWEKVKKLLLKGKDDFCCASIFSPALPTGSTLQFTPCEYNKFSLITPWSTVSSYKIVKYGYWESCYIDVITDALS